MYRCFALLLVTIILFFLNLFFGAIDIPASTVRDVLTGQGIENDAYSFIIIESRFPQAITAILAGGALAVSGLMLQTLFRNPLAGPSILGITSGASLGVAVVILLAGGSVAIGSSIISGEIAVTLGALTGSFSVMVLLVLLARRIKSNLTLLIVGMMTGYLASSLVSLFSSISSANGIQSYVMWGMGNFSSVTIEQLPWFALICIVGVTISLLMAKPLNLLLLGDNYAANLGVNVKKARFWLLISTGLLTAVVTASCGPIGFIGLAMPHIARLLLKTDDHRVLIPATIFSGAALALICNLISVMPDGNIIPINALTPIAGVPVVFYILMKSK